MRFTPRRAIAIIILAGLFVPAASGSASAKMAIGVDPGKFEYNIKPGGTAEGKIRVTNEGDETLDFVSLYVANVVQKKDGKTDYAKPTGYEPVFKSPASWIYLAAPDPTKVKDNLAYVSLKQGEGVDVKFTVNVPDNARSGDHSALVFFEVRKPVTSGTSVGGRVGSRIRVRVAGKVIEKLAIDRFDLPNLVFGSSIDYSVGVKNTGNVDIKPKISVFKVKGGERVSEKSPKSPYVFAGGRADVKDKYDLGSDFGIETVKVSIDYGENFVDRTAQVLVVPYWLAYLAGGVIACLGSLVWVLLRRRRRDRLTTAQPTVP